VKAQVKAQKKSKRTREADGSDEFLEDVPVPVDVPAKRLKTRTGLRSQTKLA
jgi:hypothetical protein